MCMHQQQRNQVHKRVLASHKVFRQIWYKNVLDSILTAFTKQFFHHWQAPIRFSHFFRVRHPQTICGRAGTKPNQTIFFAVYPVSLGNRHSTQTFSGCREKRENGPTRHWKWEIVHRCTLRLDKAFVQTNPDKHFWITKKKCSWHNQGVLQQEKQGTLISTCVAKKCCKLSGSTTSNVLTQVALAEFKHVNQFHALFCCCDCVTPTFLFRWKSNDLDAMCCFLVESPGIWEKPMK